jgi:N-acetylglucosaminyldiphosphoundecaprenol N-acetyl-beta-D-mannosaminyltransferase
MAQELAAAPPVFTMTGDQPDDDILLLDRRGRPREVAFLDIGFAPITAAELSERVATAGRTDAGFVYVVTPNVDHLVRLAREPDLRAVYEKAWINVCDSRILQTLAGWSGINLPAAPGSDLAASLLANHIVPDEPVVVIGADTEVISALRQRFNLQDVHHHQPPMGLRDNPAAIAQAAAFMAAHPARFHFLCVGSPQQELVALAALERGDVQGVGLCLGASLDFLAGKAQRAPVWMQQLRLEWLHRLLSEPQRLWKRYLIEGPAIFAIWWRWQKSQPH